MKLYSNQNMVSPEKLDSFLNQMADIFEMSSDELKIDLDAAKLEWDSLAIISTIALIDEQFGVMIPGVDLNKCSSINEILSLVDN
tara:strand:- start:490 stop:744 length:255 start_codon:yes stop_codon:yes gene_type:complete